MVKKESKPIDELSYDDAFSELEAILASLELGEQTLENALSLFERGQQLSRHCTELLTRAELKVQELTGETIKSFQETE